jgi:hypothetical protein
MSACQEYITVELIDIDNIGVLVRMKFIRILICLLELVISVLENETIGIAAIESIFK